MSEDDEYIKALEIQRRNFEAQFGSIEDMGFEDKSKAQAESEDEDENSSQDSSDQSSEEQDSEFDEVGSNVDEEEMYFLEGDEDQDDVPKPKVFKLNDSSNTPPPVVSKQDRKLLKSGRAPTLLEISKKEKLAAKQQAKQQSAKSKAEDEENLANDLKLQRLLKESHILANTLEYSGADLTLQTIDFEDPTGKARRRALDSRIRELASTNSRTGGLPKKLEKMPMAMRKGMIKKRDERIKKYEKDARDAGIVLSKVRKGELRDLDAGKGSTSSSDRLGTGKKVDKRIRDRGLKINGIGRSTRNGLVISQGEIDRVNRGGRKGFRKRR
ncbi:pre-rRNA processing protein, putative [Candida dubliniensis CD36]|uniref:Pre-rRNA processing protein, putative n=1 Tax=Candida dubliniensis (strain CD36 / ATCC MYA-646 / CBS 7987 / NCPF 3949 / NRRL Y-17841) TaxID=573826 RepID=B9WGL7_CANDC|nr:pre-rRNA processing protein, putative [Candida dubliniensis CD36]CAX42392.1 pre-rRNA processing protein, putative [Candida dubliniensis CD36]